MFFISEIKLRTGHKTTAGLNQYKRPGRIEQEKKITAILARRPLKQRIRLFLRYNIVTITAISVQIAMFAIVYAFFFEWLF